MGAGTGTVPPGALTWSGVHRSQCPPWLRGETLLFSWLVLPGISTYRCRDASLPIMFMKEPNCEQLLGNRIKSYPVCRRVDGQDFHLCKGCMGTTFPSILLSGHSS